MISDFLREISDFLSGASCPRMLCTGRMVIGELGGRRVLCMQGRFHPYEGYAYWHCAFYVWVLRELGVRLLVLTNAAGALDASIGLGQLVLIKDHIAMPALVGCNPLYALRDTRFYKVPSPALPSPALPAVPLLLFSISLYTHLSFIHALRSWLGGR